MAGTRKFKQSGGEEVEADVVGFRAAGEHWNEYLLDDGTVFKIKLVVTEIARDKDRYDANSDDGDPPAFRCEAAGGRRPRDPARARQLMVRPGQRPGAP